MTNMVNLTKVVVKMVKVREEFSRKSRNLMEDRADPENSKETTQLYNPEPSNLPNITPSQEPTSQISMDRVVNIQILISQPREPNKWNRYRADHLKEDSKV